MRNQLMRDFIWYRHTASGRVIIYHASPAQPSSGNLREVSMTPSPKSRQPTVSEEGEVSQTTAAAGDKVPGNVGPSPKPTLQSDFLPNAKSEELAEPEVRRRLS